MSAANATRTFNAIALVAREVEKQNLTPGVFARKIDRHPSTITVMMKRKDMSVSKLISCSVALRYNFFQEIAYDIHYPGPPDPHPKPNALAQEVAALNKEALRLKGEIERRDTEIENRNAEITSLSSQLQEADIKRRILEAELNTIKQIMKDLLASNRI
ncbi:MAG: hypothetical protein CVT94_04265 [Bacteroidetes bacterium HGW-Bacteroidetes-11]|jgi:hypothetical protein|nr:MAG: hypothetical protein CVT94_04265 [Bacteroidetes bacterium HGW-Bacteroidetes-11]